MIYEYLTPVDTELITFSQNLDKQALGRNIQIHSGKDGLPDLADVSVALISVGETRNSTQPSESNISFYYVREALYSLFPGNWQMKIADLGDIKPGASIEDTYFAVKQVISELMKIQIIPILIGGSQDLAYAQYRAYDDFDQMVNFVNVDCKFDLGDASKNLNQHSFVSKIITEKPYNLFNYSTIGYQTYFNAQEEIDLMEQLYFDTYRLGEVAADITSVEPILRDADFVGIDLNAINAGYLSYNDRVTPNGLDGKEICAIARYAGISDKVTSFGVFEYESDGNNALTEKLVAQIIWYFIEGVNYRSNELVVKNQPGVLKYNVPIDDEILSFYQSSKTKRWWIEIPIISGSNNKLKRHTLLPCNYMDYENACNQQIPERWYKARRKNEV